MEFSPNNPVEFKLEDHEELRGRYRLSSKSKRYFP